MAGGALSIRGAVFIGKRPNLGDMPGKIGRDPSLAIRVLPSKGMTGLEGAEVIKFLLLRPPGATPRVSSLRRPQAKLGLDELSSRPIMAELDFITGIFEGARERVAVPSKDTGSSKGPVFALFEAILVSEDDPGSMLKVG